MMNFDSGFWYLMGFYQIKEHCYINGPLNDAKITQKRCITNDRKAAMTHIS